MKHLGRKVVFVDEAPDNARFYCTFDHGDEQYVGFRLEGKLFAVTFTKWYNRVRSNR